MGLRCSFLEKICYLHDLTALVKKNTMTSMQYVIYSQLMPNEFDYPEMHSDFPEFRFLENKLKVSSGEVVRRRNDSGDPVELQQLIHA